MPNKYTKRWENMVQKHGAKSVARATRQIVGGNYKASSYGRCKGELGEWCESKKKTMRMIITNGHGFTDAIKNVRGNIEGTLRKISTDI